MAVSYQRGGRERIILQCIRNVTNRRTDGRSVFVIINLQLAFISLSIHVTIAVAVVTEDTWLLMVCLN